jgi:VanW like protein
MVKKTIQTLVMIPLFSFGSLLPSGSQNLLSYKEMSLNDRYAIKSVNDVFKENILLTLAYMRGNVTKVSEPFTYEFRLEPSRTFAFHDDVENQYKETLVKTTNAHFNSTEGFKSDGYLVGDGVCHLASLINWAAKDAGLTVEAPTNHNFANIPDVPKEYGVSIYSNPNTRGSNALQNLYITNNKTKPIAFKFEYADNKVKVSVVELN